MEGNGGDWRRPGIAGSVQPCRVGSLAPRQAPVWALEVELQEEVFSSCLESIKKTSGELKMELSPE